MKDKIKDIVLDSIRNNKIIIVKLHKPVKGKVVTHIVSVYVPPYDHKEFGDLSFLSSVDVVDYMCSNDCNELIDELRKHRFHIITR